MFQSSSCPVHKLFLVFSTMRSTSWSHMHRRTSGAKRYEEREREREAAPVGTGAATLPRLIPRSEDIASWTRRVRVLSPYATIGANWTPIQGPRGSVEWKEEERGREVARRSRRRGWPVQHVCPSCLVSSRSQGALVCSSFRVVSSFASSGARRASSPISHLPSTCIPRIVSTWNSVEIND